MGRLVASPLPRTVIDALQLVYNYRGYSSTVYETYYDLTYKLCVILLTRLVVSPNGGLTG